MQPYREEIALSKETKYIEQLKELGIWDDAFRGAVHDLAVLEREQSRARKEWKATAEDGEAPSMLDEHYQLILQQGREISKLRDALGLTPKSLRRIKTARDEAFRVGQQVEDAQEAEDENRGEASNVLDFVRAKFGT